MSAIPFRDAVSNYMINTDSASSEFETVSVPFTFQELIVRLILKLILRIFWGLVLRLIPELILRIFL